MKTTKYALPVALGLIALVVPNAVQATPITYNFSGTLANPVSGNSTVTGEFALDSTNATITAFNFITPVETISSTSTSPIWTPSVFIINGTSPNATFVNLVFIPNGGLNPPDAFELIFQTTLSAFDVSTFYTGVVDFSGGSAQSNLTCINGCNGYGSTFVAAPESSSMLLLGTGLLALMGLCLRQRRLA